MKNRKRIQKWSEMNENSQLKIVKWNCYRKNAVSIS